ALPASFKLDDADKLKADAALRAVVATESNQRISWQSEIRNDIHGYAEPIGPSYLKSIAYCYDPIANVKYMHGVCARGDRQVGEADYRRLPFEPNQDADKTPLMAAAEPLRVPCRMALTSLVVGSTEVKSTAESCQPFVP